MKVALLLSGFFNNRADPQSGMNGFDYICETVLDYYDTDVFIHSWEPDREQQLVELYAPEAIVCEVNKDFNEIAQEGGIDEAYFNEGFDRARSKFAACKVSSTLSFLYGRKAVFELMKNSGNEYDCVIFARFDLGQRDKNQRRKYHVSTMRFNPLFPMDLVYSAMWDQLNAGYADQWFYTGPENAEVLATAYDKAFEYLQPGSAYEKELTTGWRDSKSMDNMSSVDPGQFTNEALKVSGKATDLMKYPRWQAINNHLLYKWFFIDTGLYGKSAFVDKNGICERIIE